MNRNGAKLTLTIGLGLLLAVAVLGVLMSNRGTLERARCDLSSVCASQSPTTE
jgi:hypothetical protein